MRKPYNQCLVSRKHDFEFRRGSTRNTTMKEIYHQHFPLKLFIIAIMSFFFSLILFSLWGSSESLVHLFLANLFLLIFIVCSKPLIEWRRIEIENGYIIIFKRFFRPLKIKISESLYQVVMHDDNIRSFVFGTADITPKFLPSYIKMAIKWLER